MKFIAGAAEGHAGGAAMTRTSPRTGRDRPQEVVNDTNASPLAHATEKCAACLKPYRPKHIVNDTSRRRRFCSNRCRMLGWAMRELTNALAAGHAEGLRDELRRLGRQA